MRKTEKAHFGMVGDRKSKEKAVCPNFLHQRRGRQHPLVPPKGKRAAKEKLHTTSVQRGRLVFNHSDKQHLVQERFENIMSDPLPRTRDFSWRQLQLQAPDSSLDRPFSEEVIWQDI
jgi:hypothetical protein